MNVPTIVCKTLTLVTLFVGSAAAQPETPAVGRSNYGGPPTQTFEQVRASIPESMPVAAREVITVLFQPGRDRKAVEAVAALEGDAQAAAVGFLIEQLDMPPSALRRAHTMHVLPDIPILRAEEALGALGDAAVPGLLAAMQHDKANIRAVVAGRLARSHKPEMAAEVTAALTAVLQDDDPHVVLAAVGSLGRITGAVPREPLFGLLDDGEALIRLEAVRLLGATADANDARVVAAVVAMLKDIAPSVSSEAVRTLGRIGSTRTVPDLLACLDAEDDALRRAAINALSEIGDLRATLPLIRRYELADDRSEQGTIARAISSLEDPRAVPMLIDVLDGKGDAPYHEAARALGAIGSRAGVPVLIDRLDGQNPSLVRTSTVALGQIGDPAAFWPLVELLEHDDMHVAQDAATALGALNDARAIDPLVEALYRPEASQNYYQAVADALVAIKDPRVVPRLIEGMQKTPNTARLITYRTLNRLTGESFSDHAPETFDRWKQWLEENAGPLDYDMPSTESSGSGL